MPTHLGTRYVVYNRVPERTVPATTLLLVLGCNYCKVSLDCLMFQICGCSFVASLISLHHRSIRIFQRVGNPYGTDRSRCQLSAPETSQSCVAVTQHCHSAVNQHIIPH